MIAPQLNPRRVVQFARRGVPLALVLLSTLGVGRESRAESVLSVLSYNVHGLPPLIAGDNPRRRASVIGARARAYDVALFQEDFAYHKLIRRQMEGSVGICGNGQAFDLRRLAAKILLAPLSLFFSRFSVSYGAGLSTFVKSALMLRDDVDRAPFGICDGWLGADFDCWARKGYLRVGIRTPEGVVVDVYSTHLDAGHGKRAAKTRRRQLRILAHAIETQSAERPVIVGGDLNLGFKRPRDRGVMIEFRERLHLQDSGAGPERPFWRSRDYILYRSSRQAQISVEQAGEALEFSDGNRTLSDHPALYARFRVAAIPL
jgi:hypothetical protein